MIHQHLHHSTSNLSTSGGEAVAVEARGLRRKFKSYDSSTIVPW